MANIKVKELVGAFLDEINGSKNEFSRAYRIAMRGWRELNWDVTGVLKSTRLPVCNDLTAKLPDNFLKEISVGVINSSGHLATLTKNERLTLYCEDDEIPSEDWYMYESNLNILTGRGSLGIGSHNNIGEYRVDRDAGILILDPSFCYDGVVLEYLAVGEEKGLESINELASEALIAYIRWKWHIAKKGVTQGDRATFRKEYYNERRLARLRIKMPTLQEMNQAVRQSTKQGIKA